MRISDWSADVCSSDLYSTVIYDPNLFKKNARISHFWRHDLNHAFILVDIQPPDYLSIGRTGGLCRYSLHISAHRSWRSEEHTSELQSLMRISYAVFCLTKQKQDNTHTPHHNHTPT